MFTLVNRCVFNIIIIIIIYSCLQIVNNKTDDGFGEKGYIIRMHSQFMWPINRLGMHNGISLFKKELRLYFCFIDNFESDRRTASALDIYVGTSFLNNIIYWDYQISVPLYSRSDINICTKQKFNNNFLFNNKNRIY